MIRKYIKVVYISLFVALFLMALSGVLNSTSVPYALFTVITAISLFIRLVITLTYELKLLVTLLKRFCSIQFNTIKVTFSETKYTFNVIKRFQSISLYKLNVIRC